MLDFHEGTSYLDPMSRDKVTVIAVAIAFIVAFIVGVEKGDNYSCEGGVVVVKAGDTVWSLMNEQRCTGDLNTASYDIHDLNGIDGYIYPGQRLIIPSSGG